MSKKDFLFKFTVASLTAAIVVVVVIRFVLNRSKDIVEMAPPNEIDLVSIDNEKVTLAQLLGEEQDLYFLIFDMNGCYTCILSGLNDLMELEKAGRNCIAIVLHEYLDEVKGWSKTQQFSPFFMVRKSVFYDRFKIPHLPVLIQYKKGEIVNFRFLSP